jgi:hypothetical protein
MRSFPRSTRTVADDALQRAASVAGSGAGSFPDPSWAVPNWYVDYAHGNDANSGTSAAAPVKTVMGGVVAKWGTVSPVLSVPVTIWIMSSQALDAEAITLTPVLSGNPTNPDLTTAGQLTLQPYTETGAAFTLAGVVAKNRTTGELLKATAPAGATPGQLVVNNTTGSKAFIYAVAAGVMTMCQPINETSLTEDDTWANGNSMTLVTLFGINALRIDDAFLTDLTLLDPTGTPGQSTVSFVSDFIVSCWIQPYVYMGFGIGNTVYFNTYFDPGQTSPIEASGETGFNGGSMPQGINTVDASATVDVDFDVILGGTSELIGVNSFGDIYLLAGSSLVATQDSSADFTGIVWGAGAMGVASGGLIFTAAATWNTQYLASGALAIDGATTASSYVAGTWTSGVTVTVAHVDADGGLLNPVTGSRLAII